MQRLARLERFDGETAVVLGGAELLLGDLEELVVEGRQCFAGMRLKGSIEVERRPGAGNIDAVAARLIERMSGAQHLGLGICERRHTYRKE